MAGALGAGRDEVIRILLLVLCCAIAHAVEPMLSTGKEHSLYLADDGTVWAWGSNTNNQLGTGGGDSNIPVKVPGLANIIQISAGYWHSVALRADGTVWMWGQNVWGQRGNGTSGGNIASPQQVAGVSGVKQISSGGFHILALLADGTARAWGYNTGGIGNGTTTNPVTTPAVVSGGHRWRMLCGGGRHSLGIRDDGLAFAWGEDGFGQLGDDAPTTAKLVPTQVATITNVIHLGAGYDHSLAVTEGGTLYAWGRNTDGQCGSGTPTDQPTPVSAGASAAERCYGGYAHSIAVRANGILAVFGRNTESQCRVDAGTPIVAPSTNIGGLRLAGGGYGDHTLVQTSDGIIQAWGDNASGQLGNAVTGGVSSVAVNTQANWPVSGITKVARGQYHVLAVKSDGTAWAWGYNASGQAGLGNTDPYVTVPAQVQLGGNRVDAIAAGGDYGDHSLALTPGGAVIAWGSNSNGQVGDGTNTTPRTTPAAVSGTGTVRALGAGDYHSLMSNSGSTGLSWGRDDQGQLGDDALLAEKYTPVTISGIGTAVQVVGGAYFGAALLADGTVRTWGDDANGQLGDDVTSADKTTPVSVALPAVKIVAIAAGGYHMLALCSDGRVIAWGMNSSGQLGDGFTTTRYTPVFVKSVGVTDLTGIIAIGAGATHSLAIRSDGTAIAWGYNGQGEAGDTTLTSPRLFPVNVLGIANVVGIEAGYTGSVALLADGSVRCWGGNGLYQFGNGVNSGSGGITTVTTPMWLPEVQINAAGSSLTGSETGPTNLSFQLTRTGTTAGSLTVNVSASGSAGAVAGSDFTSPAATATFLPGQTTTTVTVPVLSDFIDEDSETVTLTLAAGIGYRLGATTAVAGSIADDDTAGFTLSTTSITTTELGGTGSFTVRLNSQPTANVSITLTSSNTAEGTVSPASLTFTSANWSSTQTVTVTGVNDSVDDGNVAYSISTGAATSSDGKYNNLNPADVSASNTDEDTASITVGQYYSKVLEAVSLTTDYTSGSMIYFPTGTDLSAIRPGMRLYFSSAGYMNFKLEAPILSVDDAGDWIEIDEGTDYDVGETVMIGDVGRITVKLNSQPTAAVTVTFSSSDATEGSVTTTSLTIQPNQWGTQFEIDVLPVDDLVDDGDIAWSVVSAAATSADPLYNGYNAADPIFTTYDNDTAGLIIAQSGGSATATEGGAGDTWTVALATQPTGTVVIGLTSDAQIGVSPASLSFNASTWNSPQTVTLTAVNDSVDEDLHPGVATHTINAGSTTDPVYDAVAAVQVTAQVTDDDTAGFTFAPASGLSVTEAGGTAVFTVRLNSQPTANVSIALSSGTPAEGTVAPSPLTFTNGNWNVTQNVTITGVNDNVDDGDVAFNIVTAAATSVDGKYNNLNPADVGAICRDDDTAAFVVTESGGSTAVTEGGASDGFDIRLATQPTAPVQVSLAGTQVGTSPSVIWFSAAGSTTGAGTIGDPRRWNFTFPVTVTATDDAIAEGSHAGSVSITGASGGYGSVTGSVSVAVTDNDNPGFTINVLDATTGENASTGSFTVRLTTQPTASVVFTVSSSNTAEGTVSGPDADAGTAGLQLLFTSANYATVQTVTVTGVNDSPPMVDGAVGYTVVLGAATSSDVNYGGLNPNDVAMTNADDDVAGVTVAVSDNTLSEAGATGAYSVVLNTRPTANVTITLAPDGEQSVLPGTLTFTPAAWNVAQGVTVTAVDDPDIEGAHSGLIEHSAASSDPNYNGLSGVGALTGISDVAPSITDNDTAGLVRSVASVQTSEDGGGQIFTVSLSARPIANVTVNLSITDPTPAFGPDFATVGLSTASLTFTNGNWNVPQNVTVTGSDDANDLDASPDDFAVSFTTSSGDGNFNALAVTALPGTNLDNDGPGVAITPLSGLTCGETGGVAMFTVRLNSAPAAGTVTVQLASGDSSEGTVSPLTMTFSSANFNIPQVATVSGANDAIDDGNQVFSILTSVSASGDLTNYPLALPIPDPQVTCLDDDSAALVLAVTGGSTVVNEAGTTNDTIRVSLASEPTSDVTISAAPDTQVTVAPASLTFTSANWMTPQNFTVTAVDDSLDEGDSHAAVVSLTAANGGYTGLPIATADVVVLDNDVSSIQVSAISGTVDEAGGTATFQVRLATIPSAAVAIAVSSGDPGEGTVLPVTLSFSAADWNVWQTVTVTGEDDAIADGAQAFSVLLAAAVSADGAYNTLDAADVAVTCTDNDTAAVVLAASDGTTLISEAGPTSDTYTVRLATEPTGNVTITVSPNAQVTALPASLLFTAGDWNIPQAVTVTAVDDAVSENGHTGVVAHAASGPGSGYNGMAVSDLTASIADNDAPALVISESGGSTAVSEAGGSDLVSIRLATQPPVGVSVSVYIANADGEVVLGGGTLTFDSGNWSSFQDVSVSADDDQVDEAAVAVSQLQITAPAYVAGTSTVDVLVTDDDTEGVEIIPTSGLTLTESGSGAFFAVMLNSRPSANVVIDVTVSDATEALILSPDDDPGTAGIQLVFTPTDYDEAKLVQVRGVDDFLDDGQIASQIDMVVTSAAYAGVAVPSVGCTTFDDDLVGVTISKTSVSVDEDGAPTDSYTVVLDSQPSSDVTITVQPGSQLLVDTDGGLAGDQDTLVFTSANWDTPRSVAVRAAPDDNDEGDAHTGRITHAATGGGYDGVTIASVDATIADDDVAGFIVTPAPAGSSRTTSELYDGLSNVIVCDSIADDPGNADAQYKLVQVYPAGGAPGDPIDLDPYFVGQAVYFGTQQVWGAITAIDEPGRRLTVVGPMTDDTTDQILGIAAGFTIRLASRPTSLVILSFSSDDTTEGDFFPSAITFTPETWNVPRSVNVVGKDDAIDDGDIAFTIASGAAFSADAYYNGLTAATVTFDNLDDDDAGVTVTPTSVTVDENGAIQATSTVELDSQPTGVITIPVAVADPAQASASVASLTFTSADWNVPQTITITGRDDDGVDNGAGGVLTTIQLGAPLVTGSDLAYDALVDGDVDDISVTVDRANDPPLIDGMLPVAQLEDVAPFVVTVTGLSSGQAGETQVLTVTVSSDNPSLASFSVPAVVANPHDGGAATTATFTVTPLLHANGTANVTVTVTDDAAIDGTALGTPVTFTLALSAVNDAPTVDLDGDGSTGDGYAAGTFTEGDGAMSVVDSGALLLADVDNVTADSATVTVSPNPDGAAEVLDATITGFPFLTKAYNPSTGVLTIIGAGPQPLSDFQTVLRTLTYRNTSDNPTAGVRSIAVVLNDGTADGAADTATLTVAADNDAPAIDLDGSSGGTGYAGAWTEGGGAVPAVDVTTLAVSDPDSATLFSATATLQAVPDGASEVLAATAGATGIVVSWTSPTLTLSGVRSVAAYQQVLRTLTYDNSDQDPNLAARNILVTINDGSGGTASATSTLTMSGSNDPPVLDLNGAAGGSDSSATYVEDAAAVAIVAAGLTLTDPDSVNLANGATAVIINLIDAGDEQLAAPAAPGGITVSYTAATGTLTLTGVAPVSDYQTALRSLTYRNVSQNPSTTARIIQVTVNDGAGGTDSALATVAVSALNDAPVLDLNGPAAGIDMNVQSLYVEGAPAQIVTIAGVQVTDPDSPTLAGASIVLQNRLDLAAEVLAVNTGAAASYGITVTAYNPATGTLTLSGAAGLAEYQQLIGSLTYRNTSDTPTWTAPADDRMIAITLNDGTALAAPASFAVVRLQPLNDDPVLTVGGSTSLALGNTLQVRASDGSGATATAAISGGGVSGITVVGGGSGYVSAPRAVLSGGDGNGAIAATTIVGGVVTAVTVSNPGVSYLTTAPTVTIVPDALLLTASDADNAANTLTYTVMLTPNLGTLRNGVTVLNNNSTFTVADVQAGSITYVHGGLLSGVDGFAVRLSDPGGGETIQVITLTVTGLVPPQLSIDNTVSASWIEGAAAVQLDGNAIVNDTDSANFGSGSITVANAGGRTGDRIDFDPALVGGSLVRSGADLTLGAGGAVVGTLSGGTGNASLVIGLTATCTPAIAQTIVRGLTWTNTGDNPGADPDATENRTLTVTVNDGALNSAGRVRTIVVDPVDDPPVLVAYTVAMTPGLTVPGQLVAVDPEGETVTFGPPAPAAGAGVVALAANGSFTYQHQTVGQLTDTFNVVLTEAGVGGQTANATVQVQVTVPDATAPRIVSAAPVRITAGTLFTYLPALDGFGSDLEYVLVPALQEAVSGTALANPADYTFSGGTTGSGATGTLRIPNPVAPPGGYLRTGILVIDRVSGRSAYQPLLIKIAAEYSG